MARRKYRRLPNGFGSISKLSGRRRKPFVVRAPAKYIIDEDLMAGCWNAPIIGYAETWEEGYRMLLELKDNPYDVDKRNVTLGQLYEYWKSTYYKHLADSTRAAYERSWRLIMEPYADKKVRSFDTLELERIAKESNMTYSPLRRYKTILCSMFDYGIKYRYVTKNPARFIDVASVESEVKRKVEHKRFTTEEIETLWSLKSDPCIQTVLILIYTGLRINEFLDLKKENIHLKDKYLEVCHSKTASGVRTVPIADKVLPYFSNLYDQSNDEYLIEHDKKKMYGKYLFYYWKPAMNKIDGDHVPHDTRYTCVSLLTENKVDKRIIKKIVGHKTNDVTEKVYTQLSLDTLLDAINSI